MLRSLIVRLQAGSPVRLTQKVSIGVAAHGNSATTRRALELLFASATGDYELLLIDDLSPDDTLDEFREARKLHRNTRLFAFPANLEYCNSVNAFLSHAAGDLLLFLSNDIFVNPSYLRQLLGAAAANPDAGILRGCSNFVDNSSPVHNVPVPVFPSRESFFEFAAEFAARRRRLPLMEERFLLGDAFLVTRKVLDRIGTFDTSFVGYCGDADFGLRAQIAGFRLALLQSAFAFHDSHSNIRYLPPEQQETKIRQRVERVGEALRLLFRKYGLPEQDSTIHGIPWESLRQQPFDRSRHYVAPKDYSGFLLQS